MNQNFGNVEHLIVDGGSTDGTLQVLYNFNHLKILSEPDEGIFDAMNKGISIATGDWLYFLGADDYLQDADVLTELSPVLQEDYDVVYGDVLSSRFEGRYDGAFDDIKIRKKNICQQAIFFHRRIFDRLGLFNTSYRSHADWDYNMRWVLDRRIRKAYVDHIVAVYADGGFSSVNPDTIFQRDRLFRYLTYGREVLPLPLYVALWTKELALAVSRFDLPRVKRAVSMISN